MVGQIISCKNIYNTVLCHIIQYISAKFARNVYNNQIMHGLVSGLMVAVKLKSTSEQVQSATKCPINTQYCFRLVSNFDRSDTVGWDDGARAVSSTEVQGY